MYCDTELHVALLKFLITLMLREDGLLDPLMCAQEPVSLNAGQRMHDADVCMVLYHHLNHPHNHKVLLGLYRAVQAIGYSAVRLLKLLVHDLFPCVMYGADTHHQQEERSHLFRSCPFLGPMLNPLKHRHT